MWSKSSPLSCHLCSQLWFLCYSLNTSNRLWPQGLCIYSFFCCKACSFPSARFLLNVIPLERFSLIIPPPPTFLPSLTLFYIFFMCITKLLWDFVYGPAPPLKTTNPLRVDTCAVFMAMSPAPNSI